MTPGRSVGSVPLVEIVPVALIVVAEAAWVSVIGGFIQEVRLQAPILGIPILTAFVVAGLVAARSLGPRLGGTWAFVGLALSLSAGAIGWLAAPEARASLALGDLQTAIGENPGGWVAGLAVLRGYANARIPIGEGTVARMLRLGIPGLALIAVVGGAVVEPWRGIFLTDTLAAAVVFVASGTLALAFARQRLVGSDLHVDWRRNRAWVGLLVGAVAAATLIALASSGALGQAIPVVVGIVFVPFLLLALVLGTERRTFRVVGVFVAVAVLLYLVVTSFTRNATPPPVGTPGTGRPTTPETDPAVILSLGGLGLVLTLIAILILIRLWMGQVGPVEADLDEIRTIDRGEGPVRSGRGRRRRRQGTPTEALTAYLALVEDLDGRPTVRRVTAETPAEHARRLRRDGTGDLGLDLLAADYALAGFGGVVLPAHEDRRAVARWRRLRGSLGRG